jgi:hypothetical protein
MPKITAEEKKFRAEDDLRTLRRANEIKVDSNRIKAAKQMARKEMQALKKLGK